MDIVKGIKDHEHTIEMYCGNFCVKLYGQLRDADKSLKPHPPVVSCLSDNRGLSAHDSEDVGTL